MTDPSHTILLVDDEVEILESLRRTLRSEGYRLLTTPSPFEALEIVERESVDLMVADIDMPGMNGLELVSRIRRTHPHVVRILLTGDSSIESALHAINEGEVYRYLTKPWQKIELRETLRHALDRLEEIRRAASADRLTRAREAMLSELESAHPGIRKVVYRDGIYSLDVTHLAELATEVGIRAESASGPTRDPVSGEAPTEVVRER